MAASYRIIRSQIEMPIDDNVVLNKGDVLQVSGDVGDAQNHRRSHWFYFNYSQVTDRRLRAFFIIVNDRDDYLPVQQF